MISYTLINNTASKHVVRWAADFNGKTPIILPANSSIEVAELHQVRTNLHKYASFMQKELDAGVVSILVNTKHPNVFLGELPKKEEVEEIIEEDTTEEILEDVKEETLESEEDTADEQPQETEDVVEDTVEDSADKEEQEVDTSDFTEDETKEMEAEEQYLDRTSDAPMDPNSILMDSENPMGDQFIIEGTIQTLEQIYSELPRSKKGAITRTLNKEDLEGVVREMRKAELVKSCINM